MILGEVVHDQIAETITHNLSLETSLVNLANTMQDLTRLLSGLEVVTTKRKSLDNLPKLATRYFSTWWKLVHPSSPERLDVFKSLAWPPVVERRYQREGMRGTRYGQWATIDAIFTGLQGEHTIVDWKSSVREQASDSQLDYYRYVSRLTSAKALYLNLHGGSVQWARAYPGDDQIRARIRQAESAKDRMLREMPRKEPSTLCRFCPVQAECGTFDKREYRQTRKRLVPMVDLPVDRLTA